MATDNYKGGVMAAQGMARSWTARASDHAPLPGRSQSTENREKGFLETLAKEFPGIKVSRRTNEPPPTSTRPS
ncbi:MAG: hypothetical protein Ct9H300mP1_31810 [Planctomycetaceae bacterium]|nr:MAG: hypothetical protein Ct9H300mP1_31810 [Planctomycetaceae bacterium]